MIGLGIALTLASLGAQAFAQSKQAKANNELRSKLQQKSANLDAVFQKESNMDYLQTPGMKNAISVYVQGLKDVNKNVEGRAVMAGASPEATIAEREKVNQSYGDFVRKAASGADQYRADKEKMYTLRRDSLDQQIMASDMQKANQWNNLMTSAAGLGSATITTGASGALGNGAWLSGLLKKPSAGIVASYKARGLF